MMLLFAHNYTLCMTLVGTSMLGFMAGALGVFVILRRQSLLGDAISHAALPGIVLGHMITKSMHPLILLCAGTLTGCFAIVCLLIIKRNTRLKLDAILGIILSVFFGIGLILITRMERYGLPHFGFMNSFLFGNAATLLPANILMIGILAILVFTALIVCWKELKLLTFDPAHAQTLGYNVRFLDAVIMMALVLTMVIGLQTVGVILMSSLIIAPAAAARLWAKSLIGTVALAAAIGLIATTSGTLISCSIDHLPTGPTIVLIASSSVFLSLVIKKYA